MAPTPIWACIHRCAPAYLRLYQVGARFDSKLVHTNKVSGGSYRGMGAPQIIWAIESQIEQAARTLGKDSLSYRMEIANQPGDETPLGWQIGTCALRECLAEAGRRIGWDAHQRERRPHRGIGFASMINPSVGVLYRKVISPTFRWSYTGWPSSSRYASGGCRNRSEHGTCATAAEELVDEGLIDVVHMDTELAPMTWVVPPPASL